MADTLLNQQIPTNIPSTPVLNMEGKFTVSELQQKFHDRVESLGILEEVAALEKNPVRNFAWKVFATLGFFRFGPEEAANLSDVVAKLRKGIEAVEPTLVNNDSQKNPETNVVPLQGNIPEIKKTA